MMQAVSKQIHGQKSWKRYTSYAFAAKSDVIPLVAAEISSAALTMPIAFIHFQGSYHLVAITSPISGENFFVAPDGRWLKSYVPSALRSRPFMLGRVQDENKLCLCVDDQSDLICDDPQSGEPFFDDKGELSPLVKDVVNFLKQIEQNKEITQKAVLSLQSAGLFTPWPMEPIDNDQKETIKGVYRIDATKLNSMADQDFLTLRTDGALAIAYAQQLSMSNMNAFTGLKSLRDQLQPQPSDPVEPDSESFGFGADDMIGI